MFDSSDEEELNKNRLIYGLGGYPPMVSYTYPPNGFEYFDSDDNYKRKKRRVYISDEVIDDNLEKRSIKLGRSREQRLYFLRKYYR
uniref:Uncharacterized protein n=1 Tax=Strongyloides venezuelensis TaxID=75913 RepID=A0A0K0FCW6_STRVS